MRRSPADRPVVAVKPLLPGGGGGAKGPAHQECGIDQLGRCPGGRGGTCQRRKSSRSTFPSRWCGRRTGRLRPTRVPREWTAQTLDEFEDDLKNNLLQDLESHEFWVLLSAPGRAVEIPKPHGGGVRLLGVPTSLTGLPKRWWPCISEKAEPRFHPDSYGYRPEKAAWDAVGVCRQRCWKYDWVIDLDVQKFFDSVPWDLIVKAVETVTDTPWVLLYVKRWLAAPLQRPDGTLEERDKGTPQGSAVSPILAGNLLPCICL